MTNEQRSRADLSRRGVLKGTAVIAGTAATGTAGAYRDAIDFELPAAQDDVEGRTFTLLGIVGGWQGIGPAEIDGVSNPPLRLIEGEENRIIWINGDGSHHNFVLADEEGEVIDNTDFVEEAGEFTTLEVTPDEEITQYYCQPHPVQMRGPVELIDADEVHELQVQVEDEDGNPLDAEVFIEDMHGFSDIIGRPGRRDDEELALSRFDMLEDGEYDLEVWTFGYERVSETVTIDGGDTEVTVTLPAVEQDDPTETYSLSLEEGQWVGQEPEEIADEANPTLELESGETYVVEWENAIGRHQPEAEDRTYEPLPGHNFVIATGGDTNEWNTYVRSNFLDEEGDTQTVEFVARESMGVYLDQSQLDAVGEIAIDGEAGETVDTEDETADTDGNETAEMDGNETADMDGNETAETDDNETAEIDANETAESNGNETNGNETDGNETAESD